MKPVGKYEDFDKVVWNLSRWQNMEIRKILKRQHDSLFDSFFPLVLFGNNFGNI